jgi:hypothetical protein
MTDKQLLVFGDSWPAAVKIEDKGLSFPSLIAKQLNYKLVNLAEPATSIEHAVMALMHFLENRYTANNQYTVLFCLTDPSRNMAWEPDNDFIPDSKEFWAPSCFTREMQINNERDISKIYFKHIHSNRYELYNYFKNLIFVKSLCQQFNINLFFVNNFNHQKMSFNLLSDVKIYDKTLREICQVDNYSESDNPIQSIMYNNNTYVEANGHPTIKGHQLIAETLSAWITSYE